MTPQPQEDEVWGSLTNRPVQRVLPRLHTPPSFRTVWVERNSTAGQERRKRSIRKTSTEDDTVNGSNDFPSCPCNFRGVQRAARTVRWHRDREDVHAGALWAFGETGRLRSVSLYRHVSRRKEVWLQVSATVWMRSIVHLTWPYAKCVAYTSLYVVCSHEGKAELTQHFFLPKMMKMMFCKIACENEWMYRIHKWMNEWTEIIEVVMWFIINDTELIYVIE